MDFHWITVPSVLTFLLIMCRLGGLFLTAPMLSNQSIPNRIKLGMAIGVGFMLFSVHDPEKGFAIPQDMFAFAVMAAQESLIGMMLGFAVNILFAGVQMCGDLVSTQQGLSVANSIDPFTQVSQPVIGQFYYFLAMMLFLNMNMHHVLLQALNKSFESIPLGHPITQIGLVSERFLALTGNMFVVGLMLGLPVFAVLVVTEIAMAFTTKVMPQMNIFMVALPFKITFGLIMIIISLPSSSDFMIDQYETLTRQLMGFFRN
ncbi:MAG: flagellar biosynthetic protein FliR [Cyanobacteria bacterium]|nr:flagellar biosynthetic protein FliR [Cyanobacteriota bacterium]